jgi:hypothetical protein
MTESCQPTEGSSARGSVVSLVVPLVVLAAATLGAIFGGPEMPDRTSAVLFAASTCGVGSVAAWAVSQPRRTSPAGRVAAPLAATSLRLAPALVALGWLQTSGSTLAASGAGGYLVSFYLATLAADVIRTIMVSRDGARRRGGIETN